MRHGTPEQAAIVREAIQSGGRDGFEAVLRVIQETDALRVAREHAAREADLARAALNALGDSKYKQSLLDLATFAVERSY